MIPDAPTVRLYRTYFRVAQDEPSEAVPPQGGFGATLASPDAVKYFQDELRKAFQDIGGEG